LKQHQPNIITTTDEERPSFYSAIMECHYYRNPQQKKTPKIYKKNILKIQKKSRQPRLNKKITGIPIFPSGFSLPIFHPNVVRNFSEFVANFFLKNTNYCSSDPDSPI